MKVVILAGGLGSRISEESIIKPKPLVEIGSKPIIWHIMKIYSYYGLNEFIICCGYKGYLIKEYFANYSLHTTDITVDFNNNKITVHRKNTEPWKVTLVDTGDDSQTGQRIKKIEKYLDNTDTFCLTYGDGLSSVNIKNLIKFHNKSKKLATVLAVKPAGRFGAIKLTDNLVQEFLEKPQGDKSWINGGFFVLKKDIFKYIKNSEKTIFEKDVVPILVKKKNVNAYLHNGFWQCMDNLRDKNLLNSFWKNKPRWKVW